MPTKKPSTAPTSDWHDPDEAPRLDAGWFDTADLYEGDRLVRKGGRPKLASPKQAVSLRLDAEVLEHFRRTGPGWQSRINAALRKAAGIDDKGAPNA